MGRLSTVFGFSKTRNVHAFANFLGPSGAGKGINAPLKIGKCVERF
jgi:hypothetical protein